MRLDSVLDSVYVLGSLWGSLTGPQVCPAIPPVLPPAAPEITWVPAWTPASSAPGAVTAFVDVNVVPMDTERVFAEQTVLVEGGRITALGPSSKVQVPAGAVRIDGRGQYLIPGLADMHPHGGFGEARLPAMQDGLFRELASGVTTVRYLRDVAIDPQQKMSRHFFTAITGPIPRSYIPPDLGGLDPRGKPKLDSVAAYVAAAKAAGYDHIGIMIGNGLAERDASTLALFDSLLVAARRVGLPLVDHSHRLPFGKMLALGTTGGSVEHLSGVFWDTLGLWESYKGERSKRPTVEVPLAKIPALAAAVQRAGVWVTPTLECMERRHRVKGLPQIVKAMQEAGVRMFLAGDDGGDVHDELAALVGAGLTPYQALVTGTRNVAEYLRLLDSSGTVAIGKRADLVLLYGNPLTDIRHAREPVGVMIAGRWLDRAALDQGLLASPKEWIGSITSSKSFRNENTTKHGGKLTALANTLATTKPSDRLAYERVLRQFATELGALRVTLGPKLHAMFDPQARVWLREQARQGYQVAVPGVAPTP
jgi:imidazolonepropionase-like amidohydrolase